MTRKQFSPELHPHYDLMMKFTKLITGIVSALLIFFITAQVTIQREWRKKIEKEVIEEQYTNKHQQEEIDILEVYTGKNCEKNFGFNPYSRGSVYGNNK